MVCSHGIKYKFKFRKCLFKIIDEFMVDNIINVPGSLSS